MKTCSMCKQTLPLREYYIQDSGKPRSMCRRCFIAKCNVRAGRRRERMRDLLERAGQYLQQIGGVDPRECYRLGDEIKDFLDPQMGQRKGRE